VSSDGGATWAKDDSLPGTVVTDLVIEQDGDGYTLFAFTYGRGAWRARLDGAPECGVSGSADVANVGGNGGRGVLAMSAPPGCRWTALSDSDWLSIDSPASGQGNGTVNFRAPVNSGPENRSACIVVGSQTVTVSQAAGGRCTYTVSTNPDHFPAIGGN